jgi:hypothetical protein
MPRGPSIVLESLGAAALVVAWAACGSQAAGDDGGSMSDASAEAMGASDGAPSDGPGADVDAQRAPDAAPCGGSGQACCADYACGAGLSCDGKKCVAAVAPFACPSTEHGAVFVTETAPAATMAPWARSYASVTYANCGAASWSATAGPPTGTKLGPSAPRDLDLWIPGRIALPADVPPGSRVTTAFAVHAPPLTGPHAYAVELVQDGVAWLGKASPTHTLTVQTQASAAVTVCAGHVADPSGVTDATAALQACIDATPSGGTLALPPGIFRVQNVVSMNQPLTLTTAGASGAVASCLTYDAPPCAVLRADPTVLPSAANTRGFVRLGPNGGAPVSKITLDHVVIDGNRAERFGSAAASACASGQNGDGINVGANCASCSIVGSVSARAVCGSGMEWDGDGIQVQNSVFWGNGDHGTQNMWSDGLTIHKSDGGVVNGCRFVDNSDVDLISGGGVNAQYTANAVSQLSQTSFAGIMLDNFDSAALGDHAGAKVTGNVVECPAGCHFGIELGPHPWYASPNIQGGTVSGNTVLGAYIEINAQGAGTAKQPTVIGANTLGPTPASGQFICGTVSGLSPLNVSAESVVTLQGVAATGAISVPCP